jgi:hypothetical protein
MSDTLAAPATNAPAAMDPNLLFDQDVFTLLGVPDAPEEKKQEMLKTMTDSINNRIFARVLDMIDDSEAETLNQLLEEDGDVSNFLNSHGINLSTIAAQEAVIYKTELVTLAAAG